MAKVVFWLLTEEFLLEFKSGQQVTLRYGRAHELYGRDENWRTFERAVGSHGDWVDF